MTSKTVYLLFVALAFFAPLALQAESWTPTAQIPGTKVDTNIALAYNSTTKQLFATWNDASSQIPTYSIYSSNSGWSAPFTIDPAATSVGDVSLAADLATGKMMAAWVDIASGLPTYSIYTPNSGWSPGAPILSRPASPAVQNVTLVYKAATQQFFAAWSDQSTNFPTTSIYTAGLWAPPQTLSNTSTSADFVTLGYNSTSQEVFAAWNDSSNSLVPTYSIYTTSWSLENVISPTASVQHLISLAFNQATNQMVAAWTDGTTTDPTYSLYSAGAWSTPLVISTTSEPFDDVLLAYDPIEARLFAAWSDNSNNFYPTYSILKNGLWSTPQTISTSFAVCDNVTLGFNEDVPGMFAAWQESANTLFDWSVFQLQVPPAPVAPQPPRSFSGKITRHNNHFKLKTTWKKSPSSDVVAYEIYGKKKRIKTLARLNFKKLLHPRTYYKEHLKKYTHFLHKKYKIRAVSANGLKSTFIHLKIKTDH